MKPKALEDKYIKAILAIWNTGLFTKTELGKMFYVDRTTVANYIRKA